MCCQAPPARPGARSRCGRRSEVGVGVGVVNGWWVGGVPGYPCAPEPEVTSPFLLGDSRTHVLRKKVMALRDGDGPGPPPLLPCFSSPPGRRPPLTSPTPPRTCGPSQKTGPPRTSPAARPPLSRPERLSSVESIAEEALLPFSSDPSPLGAMQPPILPGTGRRLVVI